MPRSRTRPRVAAATHNAVLDAAMRRVDEHLETRLADVVAPVLRRAGEEAAKAFRARVTDHLTASALRRADRDAIARSCAPADISSLLPPLVAAGAYGDVSPTTAMVCVKPRQDEAEAIADPGGAPPETLHVTLAFLGEVEDDALEPIRAALAEVAATHGPLSGVVGGYGEFRPPGVGILLPDVPGLVELRVALTEALVDAGIDYGRNHGFQAHITVDAAPEDGEIDEMLARATGAPLHFDSLLVVRGDATALEVPLVGVLPVTASALTAAGDPEEVAFRAAQLDKAIKELRTAVEDADPVGIAAARAELNDAKEKFGNAVGGVSPLWTAPAGDEVLDVQALAESIRAKTEPARKALVETTMTPSLAAAGLSFEVTNPLTAKALASTGAKIGGISDTTRSDVMQVIQSAWQSGLSIEHTAQMIDVTMQADAMSRARTIARTELVGAVNGGSLAATKLVQDATGDAYDKAWMTAPGAKYPRHELYEGLDGQTVALDEKFDVGGAELDHPGDPNGDPAEVINCRCALRYVDRGGSQTAQADEPPASAEETAVEPAAGEVAADATTAPSFSADIGVTPFRAGEDQAVGFYESDKYGQFVNDVHDSAASYGVTVDGLDRVTGVWQGDTEPSVSLRIHDGEKGVRAYAANLGNAYHQDGVLIFGDQAAGDVMATFQNPLPQGTLTDAMAKAGIDGGRFTADGRLQVIGSGPEFVKQLDTLAEDIGPYDASVGRFELLERDSGDYGKAIQAFGPPSSKAVRSTFDEPTMWGQDAAATASTATPLTEDAAAASLDETQAAFGAALSDANVAAVNDYLTTGYEGINSSLRSGAAVTPYQQRVIDGLDSTIAQAPPLAQDATLWRGVTSPETAFGTADLDSLVGKTITDPGFGSTTTARKVGVESARGGTVLKILAPAGTQGAWVPGLARSRNIGGDWGILERELILPRGARYQVVSVAGDEMTVRLLPSGG